MKIDQIMNPSTPSKVQLLAAFDAVTAVAEAVREAGEIPSGTLYAILTRRSVTLEGYQRMLDILKGAGLIEVTAACLVRWIGPKVAA